MQRITATTTSTSVQLEVHLAYLDRDRADDAAVYVVLHDPSGASVGPVRMRESSVARYRTEVETPVPGQWRAVFRSEAPSATASVTFVAAVDADGVQGPGDTNGWATPMVVALALGLAALSITMAFRRG